MIHLPRTGAIALAALFTTLTALHTPCAAQEPGTWDMASVPGFFDVYANGEVARKDVGATVHFYLHTRSGGMRVCLLDNGGGCEVVQKADSQPSAVGRYRLVPVMRPNESPPNKSVAAVAILDTTRGKSWYCAARAYDAGTKKPRNSKCVALPET